MQRGRDWAIRCSLEAKQHEQTCWVTLTYDDEHLPPTLRPEHLSGFLKRLRTTAERSSAAGRIRFFGCGEYGEQRGRPHYHAILFGHAESTTIARAWTAGRIQVDTLTPAAIAYVAGYCTKKAKQQTYWRRAETFDPETGEVLYEHPDGTCRPYAYQEPFLRMSRRPGIGAQAKIDYRDSWKKTAIYYGREVPAPRVFKEHWKLTATEQELQQRGEEINELIASLPIDHLLRLKDAAKIALSQHQLRSEQRRL